MIRRAPLTSGRALLRRTPLARVGRTAKSRARQRAKVIEQVRARDCVCQAQPIILIAGLHVTHQITCAGPLDVHEVIPRSAWPAGELEVDNCILVCRRHHAWIDANPAAAASIGLHAYSWDRP